MNSANPATASLSPNWHLHSIKIINWGGFEDFVEITFDDEEPRDLHPIIMITGKTGSGKSTLSDTNTAVMMPATTGFNSASNRAEGGQARGADRRTLATYIRGKLDTVLDDRQNAEAVYLRGRSTSQWTALTFTWRNVSGRTFCAMRVFFLKALALEDKPDQYYITADHELDPTQVEQLVIDGALSRGNLRKLFPSAMVHEGVSRFFAETYRCLGISKNGNGTSTMSLFHRMQAGASIKSVDNVFKDLVLDESRTFELAAKAVEVFDREESVYQEMELDRKKLKALGEIEAQHDEYSWSESQITLIDSLKHRESGGAFAFWESQTKLALLESAEDEYAARLTEDEVRRVGLERDADEKRQRYLELAAAASSNGADRIDQLKALIKQQNAALSIKERSLSELKKDVGEIEGVKLPGSETDFQKLKGELLEFAEGAEDAKARLEGKAGEVDHRGRTLKEEARDMESHLKYLERHRVCISPAMADARGKMADALGVSPDRLPYVAELIDVAESEESWRMAANIGFHALASTVLVDARDLRRLSASIDKLALGRRVTFQGVDLGEKHEHKAKPGFLSSKLVFKEDSPFIGWVKSKLADERNDFECVEGPEHLDGRSAKITYSGQTRKGKRGAHGHGKDYAIIGFNSEKKIRECRKALDEMTSEIVRLQAEYGKLKAEILQIDAKKRLSEKLAQRCWDDFDVKKCAANIAQLEADCKELSSNANLRLAIEKRDAAGKALSDAEFKFRSIENDIEATKDALAKAREDRAKASDALLQLKSQGVSPSESQVGFLNRKLGESFGRKKPGTSAILAEFDDIIAEIRRAVDKSRRELEKSRESNKLKLEDTFREYHGQFLDEDTNIGTEISSYPDYLAIYQDIKAQKISEPKEGWLVAMLRKVGGSLATLDARFSSEVNEYMDRIEPINDILGNYEFGADKGTLKINVSERSNARIGDLRRRLRTFSAYATYTQDDFAETDLEKEHRRLGRLMDDIRENHKSRNAVLDSKSLIEISMVAEWPEATGRQNTLYKTINDKSGGETQELLAFILGSALLYSLGDNAQSKPSYATLFLDEGFIKADPEFTHRALNVLKGLGFQVIVCVPTEKAEGVAAVADKYYSIIKDGTGRMAVKGMERVDVGAFIAENAHA